MSTGYERAHEFNTGATTDTTSERPSGILSKAVGEAAEPYSLRVTPIPFDTTTESKLVTTLDIAANINAIFKRVFRDYDGCNLVLDPNQNRWKATLYFRENVNIGNQDAVPNITPLSSKAPTTPDGKPSIGRRLESITMLQSNIHYSLTKETTDALQKYYMPWEKNQKTGINWKFFLTEQSDPAPYGYSSSAIYVCVSGVDVIELLKDIYGRKNEEDHWVDYSIVAIRPITQYQAGSTNLLLGIQRVDCEEVKDLYAKIGAIQPHGTLPIIR